MKKVGWGVSCSIPFRDYTAVLLGGREYLCAFPGSSVFPLSIPLGWFPLGCPFVPYGRHVTMSTECTPIKETHQEKKKTHTDWKKPSIHVTALRHKRTPQRKPPK